MMSAASEQLLALTPELYDLFNSASDYMEEARIMYDASQIRYHRDNAKSEIIQEYLYHNLHFCKQHKLQHHDMLAVMQVVEIVYRECMQYCDVAEADALEVFRLQAKRLLLSGDEGSTKISLDVFAKFSEFFTRHFIRHLKLYQSVLHIPRPEIHKTILLPIQTPLIPTPLAEGMSE